MKNIINEIKMWKEEGYVPGRVAEETPVHVGTSLPFVSIRAYFAHDWNENEIDALVGEAKKLFPMATAVTVEYDAELDYVGEVVDLWPRIKLSFSSRDEAEVALRAVA